MFTVLHRGPDGSEKYYECQSVTRFTEEGQQTVPPLGIVRLTNCGGFCGVPGEHIDLAIEEPFGAVFVMNSEGTTITKYTLAGKQSDRVEAPD